MVSVTTSWHYPSSFKDTSSSYASGKYYKSWNNLANIKKNEGVATCKNISGKNGSYPRPSYIVAKGFGFNIPSFADITKVEVQIGHKKVTHSSETAYPSIGKASVGLYNVSDNGASLSAPTKSLASTKATFSINPSVSSVNNGGFGVKLSYPANSNTNPGDLQLKYIAIRVTYNVPRFSLSVARTTNDEIKINDDVELKTSYSPIVSFSLPSGLDFGSKVRGNGSVSVSNRVVSWKPKLGNSVASDYVVIKLKALDSGDKTVSIGTSVPSRSDPSASSVSYTAKCSFNVSSSVLVIDEPVYSDDSPFAFEVPSRVRVGADVDLKILFKSLTEDIGYLSTFNLRIQQNNKVYPTNECFKDISLLNGDVQDNLSCHVLYLDLVYSNGFYSDCLDFTLTPLEAGDLTIMVLAGNEPVMMKTIKVVSVGPLAYTLVEMTGEQLNRLGEGINYTATSYVRINVPEENTSNLSDLGGNFRFGVFNKSLSDFDEGYILDNAFWTKEMPSSFNEFNQLSVDFDYQSDCPVYFIWTSDYLADGYHLVSVDFTNPLVVESEEFDGVEKIGVFPKPINEIIKSETSSQLNLDFGEVTNGLKCYDFDCENLNSDDIVINGVELDIDVSTLDGECSVFAKLISPNIVDGAFRIGERSIILNDSENPHIHMGGDFDLWGLKFSDFETFSQFQLELQIVNPYSGSQSVEFNNVVLTVHYTVIEDSKFKCFVNGEDTRFYNMFVKKVDIPMGVETDTQYMEVSGTDTTNAYRMNIDKKEIKIDFRVSGCTVEETTKFMERIAKLFTNPRDILNRPKTNRIEFDHFPNRYWNVIMEKPIDNEVEFVDYEGTIKLVVPDGTSYNVESTTTSAIGTNSGIAKVNPLIQISPNQSKISILEEYTNQKFIIDESEVDIESFDGFSESDVIRIDCEDRKVYYYPLSEDDLMDSLIEVEHEHLDITHAVDFNSNWFVIYDDYKFTSDGTCDIHFVEFFERW